MENLKKIIKEEMSRLPKEHQEMISIFEWENISKKIGEEHKLTEEEILILQTEIALVFLGLTKLELFFKNIEENIGLSEKEASIIENEAIKKIFTPMYNTLTENIKNNLKDRAISWQQNLDFILSGGDYTVFLRKIIEKNETPKKTWASGPSKFDGLKNNLTF